MYTIYTIYNIHYILCIHAHFIYTHILYTHFKQIENYSIG